MAKQKTVTHLLATPPPAPRLVAQVLVAIGDLMTIAVGIVGVITVVGWVIAGAELQNSEHVPGRWERPRPQPTTCRCWLDLRYGEMCEPADRPPPVRRHYARDFY